MTNESENVSDLPFFQEIEPAKVSLEWDAEKAASGAVRSPRPWGPWATVGWSIMCLVALFGVQIAVEIIFVIVRIAGHPGAAPDDLSAIGAELSTDGNMLAAATLASTPVVVGLVTLLIWIRGCPIREYLGLKRPSARSLTVAIAGLAVVLVGTDLTSYLLGRPLVPKVMVDFYCNSWLPFLVFAVVVLAPLGEETLFRGFLYKGIASSRAGPITAIVVSTMIFALIHFQYDWYGVLGVGVMGLYLGIVRYGSSSLLLTMVLHAIANMVATAEIFVQLHWAA
jgi:uncharacterized protein